MIILPVSGYIFSHKRLDITANGGRGWSNPPLYIVGLPGTMGRPILFLCTSIFDNWIAKCYQFTRKEADDELATRCRMQQADTTLGAVVRLCLYLHRGFRLDRRRQVLVKPGLLTPRQP
jgi:hypothetical protein